MNQTKRVNLIVFLLVCLVLTNCTILKSGKPNLPRIYNPSQKPQTSKKNPVIVIPGVLGSRLVNQKNNEVAWPKFAGATSDLLALPITSTDFRENRDDLVATEIIERAKFFRLAPEIGFYDSLLTSLEQAGGYRHGDWDKPPADGAQDTYYVFAYDWRRDNVEAAQLLCQKIIKLKARLNRPDLRFDIVAHSMGGLVARYCAMYGDRDVLDSPTPQPSWEGAKHLARLLLFGTPNSGSMDALSTILNGYSVLGTNLPQLKLLDALDRDAIFTSPAIYQLLPHNGGPHFYDNNLVPLEINIFALESWRKYGWSIAFDEGFKLREQKRFQQTRRKLRKNKSPEAETRLGEMEEAMKKMFAAREPFLQAVLDRAARFQKALDVVAQTPDSLQYFLFGGDCEPTLAAAVIVEIKGKPETFFRASRALGKSELRNRAYDLMFAPGDNRVTRQSLYGLHFDKNSGQLTSILPPARQVIFHCESHGDLPLNATMQDNLLNVLLGNKY